MADIKSNIETKIPLEGEYKSPEALEAEEGGSKEVLQSPESTDQTTKKIRAELGKPDEEVTVPTAFEEASKPIIEGVSPLTEEDELESQRENLMGILHGDTDIVKNASESQEIALNQGKLGK